MRKRERGFEVSVVIQYVDAASATARQQWEHEHVWVCGCAVLYGTCLRPGETIAIITKLARGFRGVTVRFDYSEAIASIM